MKLNILLPCLVFAWTGIASQPDLSIHLPQGPTSLADIGIYKVGWQSYGGQPTWMPLSWEGHFDAITGISYSRWGTVLGRDSLLLHSPWHVPPGKTWVDYQLDLPAGQSVALDYGIIMGNDSMLPDRSDGVTFSVYLVTEGQTKELLREHYAKDQWEDHKHDLSMYAGKTVTLRLQVEPGPKNNASYDYSFFGNPKIIVGNETNAASVNLNAITSSKAYKAVETIPATALSNHSNGGIIPSNILPAQNNLEARGKSWIFTYKGNDCTLTYEYTPDTGTLNDFTVHVDGNPAFQPAGSGLASAYIEGKEVPLSQGKLINIDVKGSKLHTGWNYTVGTNVIHIDWTFELIGKALSIQARSENPVISRFSLGTALGAIRQNVFVPYMLGQVQYLPADHLYTCRYLDWTQSQSSSSPQGDAEYHVKTDGTRNPLFETGYIAVSPNINEVIPNLPSPASPFLSTLGDRIMLDIWNHNPNYSGDADDLIMMKDMGVDHVAIIQHVWQRFGYDVKLPDHIPANPEYGTEADLKRFGNTANEVGYIWALHENYIDLYPDAPSYDASAQVLQSDGTPSKAWYNAGTRVQSFGLKCNRALEFARKNSPEIHKRYGTTAAYLDVHTCVPPWHQLDHEANQPMAAMEKAKTMYDTQLFQYERDTHQGPLFGEGHFQFYWGGRCDAVEAQVDGGEDHKAYLDFDLLKLHPQMVNHGMGYYERWFSRGEKIEYGIDTGSTAQWDKYRAMELAYGHAGFVGNVLCHHLPFIIREHHLVHPVQKLYGTAKPVSILYEVNGQLVTASAALACGNTTRQVIRYDSGLTLWVNWSKDIWTVTPEKQTPQTLPQWGFLAIGPDTHVKTALIQGKVADYVECPEYLFADARTHIDYPYHEKPIDIEPSIREFKYLGSNRVEVTYQWTVNETLPEDYTCFIHGIRSLNEPETSGLVFQGDHGFKKPTSQWKQGEVILDGPHELKIDTSSSQYDLVAGLYKERRLRLKGCFTGSGRILLAHLNLKKQDNRITDISAIIYTNKAELPPLAQLEKVDFSANVNTPGTWIDFGKIATDGSIKINREANKLVIFPYPRNTEFSASLDVKSLIPTADPEKIRVHALAAKTQADLGLIPVTYKNGRLVIQFGMKDAGRYVITW